MAGKHNRPTGYTRDAIISWLEAMTEQGKLPTINWKETLEESLPPVIWRKDWNKLKLKYGLPWSRGHIANLDSSGDGPASYMADRQDR